MLNTTPIWRMESEVRMALLRVYVGRHVEVTINPSRTIAGPRSTATGKLLSVAWAYGGGAEDLIVVRAGIAGPGAYADYAYSGAVIESVREAGNA